MLHAEPGMRVRVVLLRKTANGVIPIARTTVRVHVRGRRGADQESSRALLAPALRPIVVRAIFRGDAHHMPSHARARVHL